MWHRKYEKKRAKKLSRRNNFLQAKDDVNSELIQEDDFCDLDICESINNSQEDCYWTKPQFQMLQLDYLIKNSTFLEQKQKPKNFKKRRTAPRNAFDEIYETPRISFETRTSLPNVFCANFCDIHGLGVESRQCLSHLKNKYPTLELSHLGESLRGSIKVMCSQIKVAFFLMWVVDTKGYDVQLLPFINCSTLQIDTLTSISKNFCEELTTQFEDEVMLLNSFISNEEEKFCVLCSFILNNSNEAKITYRVKHHFESVKNLANPLKSTMKRFKVDVQNSLDYYDFACKYLDDKYEAPTKVMNGSCEEMDDSICPICFDEYDGNDIQLMTCGHKFCQSCWKGLLSSSALSGDKNIYCPAYKCCEKLTLSDVSHLLFERCKTIGSEDTKVLMKLTGYKIDELLLKKTYIHCSTPSCNHVLKPDSTLKKLSSKIKCNTVCLCICGAMTCRECGNPSHFGLSCDAAKRGRHEVETGNMSAELQSLLWVGKNATPCPRCFSPINKNGGCNHVRCANCGYYFCWVCGGDGTKCGAFSCHNTGIVTWGKSEESHYLQTDLQRKIKNHISLIKGYHNSVQKVKEILTRNAGGFQTNDRKQVLEFKVQSILVWLYGIALDKTLCGKTLEGSHIMKEISSFEIVLKNIEGDRVAIDSIINKKESFTRPHKNNVKNNRRKDGKESKDTDDISLEKILQALKLQSMNDNQLSSYVASKCQIAMTQLIRLKSDEIHTNELDDTTNHLGAPILLNQRKKIMNSSWKGERRFEENRNDNDYIQRSKKAKPQWKGKVKIVTRRNHMLNNTI